MGGLGKRLSRQLRRRYFRIPNSGADAPVRNICKRRGPGFIKEPGGESVSLARVFPDVMRKGETLVGSRIPGPARDA